ncbi:MAG TPA: DinB family protein [Longimicrobium sp.]
MVAWSRPELLSALEAAEREVCAFFGSLPAADFISRPGEAWSPAEHLRHLNRAVFAVGRAFSIPRMLLRVRFGRARAPSREYDELRDRYRALLAAGGRASGEFVPPREEVAADAVEPYRARILAHWAEANRKLRAGLGRWSEAELERIRLPHPILGWLTAREMVFFTVYHAHHHVEAARRRLRDSAPLPT